MSNNKKRPVKVIMVMDQRDTDLQTLLKKDIHKQAETDAMQSLG